MSRNPFTTLAPADSKYLQAGFTFGGPIKRNKLFFFGDFVRTSDDSGRLIQGHVPEAAFRNGDFSAAPTRIYDPSTGNADGSGRTQFANNQIPQSRISPIARRLIDAIPMPNIPGAAVGAHQLREELRQGAANESRRHQDHLSGRAERSGFRALQRSRTPGRWTLRSSASMAVSSRLPERAPIRRRVSAAPTTAYGRRHWCRRFVSAARITTTRRLARTTC